MGYIRFDEVSEPWPQDCEFLVAFPGLAHLDLQEDATAALRQTKRPVAGRLTPKPDCDPQPWRLDPTGG